MNVNLYISKPQEYQVQENAQHQYFLTFSFLSLISSGVASKAASLALSIPMAV